jgi:hypothetical protein
LLMLQRLNENGWQPLTTFPLKIWDNISSSGSSTRITASSHRGEIWSGPKFQTCMNILNTYFVTVPEISGSPLVSLVLKLSTD